MNAKKLLTLVNDERLSTKVGAPKGCCFPDSCSDVNCGSTDVCNSSYADYCSTAENCISPDGCDTTTNPPDYCSKDSN